MPPEIKCPYCEAMVPDWHFEWHTKEDQAEIFSGTRSMECPLCRTGVAFDGFVVTKVESERKIAKRDVLKAARWAQAQNKNLREYLQTPEGVPYVTVWTEADVETADKSVAEEEG